MLIIDFSSSYLCFIFYFKILVHFERDKCSTIIVVVVVIHTLVMEYYVRSQNFQQ